MKAQTPAAKYKLTTGIKNDLEETSSNWNL